jgi:hypothetical protein
MFHADLRMALVRRIVSPVPVAKPLRHKAPMAVGPGESRQTGVCGAGDLCARCG